MISDLKREILFRGKRIGDGKWVYGYYYQKQNPFSEDGIPVKHFISELAPFGAQIDPTSVGQYTGLKDKNGNMIFEGDVVHCGNNYVGYNQIEVVAYVGGGFNPFAVPGWECTPRPDDVIVIGNIYDNKQFRKPREETN